MRWNKGDLMYVRGLVILGLVLGLVGCRGSDSDSAARQVATAFVQAYYVNTDIAEALKYCDGLACETLKKELALREGQTIGADTLRPRISAVLAKVLATRDGAKRFLFDITVKPSGIDPFERETYVKVRESSGIWKVSQFAELKTIPPGEASGP